MQYLSNRNQLFLSLFLAALLALTRSHHMASLEHLPDASWAVFFVAGFYIRPAWPLAVYCGLAALVDYVAISWGGVSSFCVTPAYIMLLPAYVSLWLGGRWYARHYRASPTTLATLVASMAVSAFIAELCSSGGFYFLGGRIAEPSLVAFIQREFNYFPSMIGAMALYVGLAALIHVTFIARAPRMDADGPRTLLPGKHS